MRHSLEHVYNPVNVTREVRRILKPGGIFIVGVPNIDSFVSRVTGAYWGDLDIPRHLFHFTPLTIRNLFDKVGFFIDKIDHEHYVNRRSLKRWLTTIPLPVLLLPKPLKDIMGIFFSILHKGERIIVKARKIPHGTETEKFSTYEN